MCLTEAHCGTDLGQMKSKAEPQADGTYKITGSKIFISSGEHDLTKNIVHIVLARLPDAPAGTRGISLFIVPKYLPGKIGEPHGVSCGSIEHKMGIKASATCVINFDGATGFMIAEPNKGLEAMFTFMNSARIGTAMQGVCHAELSHQGAVPYALDRRSMRALSGKKDPEHVADAIIHHGDVRRMLLTQKAIAEGGRSMIYYAAQYADNMISGLLENDMQKYEFWDDKLGFLTPILKGFLTEMGLESANLGMQVFGGHGYIKEHGMEQIYRDARIATLYEGTTGIQAMDLIGRKVVLDGYKLYAAFSKKLYGFALRHLLKGKRRRYSLALLGQTLNWSWKTIKMLVLASRNRDAVSAASYDFLMFSGYLSMAYYWAMMAETAASKLAQGSAEQDFYQGKLETAEFYFTRLLPRAGMHGAAMDSSTASVMGKNEKHFTQR